MGERNRSLAAGAAAALLCGALAVALYGVRPGDLAVPIWYEGDALFTLALAKGVLRHGWFLHNPDLGAPYGLEMHDFPYPVTLHFAALKALGLLGAEPGAVVNLYWLLGFPLIGAAAFAALRALGVARAEAFVAAVLYAFLPYHLWRGEQHLFLSMYYLVPLVALVAVRLQSEAARLASGGGRWPRVRRGELLFAAVLAVLLGATGFYYAVFACFFFAVAGVLGALRARRLAPAVAALGLAALVAASTLANVAPTLRHQQQRGPNREIAARQSQDAEIYGLKIAPMLLPVPAHPLPALARLRARYVAHAPLVNENESASLGIVAGAGFLLLLGCSLAGRWHRPRVALLDELAPLNLAATLLGTVGGFGSLAALLVLPGIRAYNRISIFIAFFALAAVASAARPLRERLQRTRAGRALGGALLAAVLVLGIADVVSPLYVPDRDRVRATWERDRRFVAAAEAALPPHAMVFELPDVPFPEQPPPAAMQHYDSLRPYLHARTLRWSHAAIKGRPGAARIAALAARPADELPEALAAQRYAAILVDRRGYPDRGAALAASLAARLGAPLESEDGNWLLFRLDGAAAPR